MSGNVNLTNGLIKTTGQGSFGSIVTQGNIEPSVDNIHNLGSSSQRFANSYVNQGLFTTLKTTGNIGIGTNNPTSNLHITATGSSGNTVYIDGVPNPDNSAQVWMKNSKSALAIDTLEGDGNEYILSCNSAHGTCFKVNDNANVGINTTPQSGVYLTVNGDDTNVTAMDIINCKHGLYIKTTENKISGTDMGSYKIPQGGNTAHGADGDGRFGR